MRSISRRQFVLGASSVIAASAFGLAGCSSGGAASSGSVSSAAASSAFESAQAASSAAADAGSKTLEVWFPATAKDGNDAELWADIVAGWEQENDCKVNFQFISWKDYEAKYASGISTGEGPDVGYMYVEMYPTYIDSGAVEDLGNYLTDKDYETYAVLDDRYKIFGKNYGIATSGMDTCNAIVVNKGILKELGESMPKNWDDINRIAQAATTGDRYGIAQGWGQTFYQDLNWNWYQFVYQAGGDLFDKETGECILDSEEGIAAAKMLYDFKNTLNVLPEDTMSLTTAEAFNNYFLTGKAAMAFVNCGSGNLNLLHDTDIDYEFAIYIEGPNGDVGNWAPADQYTLMSAAKDKDLAWSFIQYITKGDGAEAAAEMKSAAPCIKDADFYFAPEETREMLEKYADTCAHPLTAARRAPEVYDYLWKTLQGMMNGDMTPEEAMADVTKFANGLDYQAPKA